MGIYDDGNLTPADSQCECPRCDISVKPPSLPSDVGNAQPIVHANLYPTISCACAIIFVVRISTNSAWSASQQEWVAKTRAELAEKD